MSPSGETPTPLSPARPRTATSTQRGPLMPSTSTYERYGSEPGRLLGQTTRAPSRGLQGGATSWSRCRFKQCFCGGLSPTSGCTWWRIKRAPWTSHGVEREKLRREQSQRLRSLRAEVFPRLRTLMLSSSATPNPRRRLFRFVARWLSLVVVLCLIMDKQSGGGSTRLPLAATQVQLPHLIVQRRRCRRSSLSGGSIFHRSISYL
jgi:hypothetical protein